MFYQRYFPVEELHLVVEILAAVNANTSLAAVKSGKQEDLADFFAGFEQPSLPVQISNPWFEKVYALLQDAQEITLITGDGKDRQIDLYRLYDGGWTAHDTLWQQRVGINPFNALKKRSKAGQPALQ